MFLTWLDRNECSLGTHHGGHNCPAISDCINTIGSFYCQCHDGYVLDNSDSIPRCIGKALLYYAWYLPYNTLLALLPNISSNNQRLVEAKRRITNYNTPVSIPSFLIDINECLHNSCPENSECINNVPGFRCVCKEGYQKQDGACLRE